MAATTDPFEFVPGAAAPTGRVALVTGGGRGPGAEVVRALASRGWSVAIHCHRSLREARQLADSLAAAGVPALAVTANLREEGPVRVAVHRVADHFGRIDALVGCAGLRRPGRLEDVTADDLRAHFEVNCLGAAVAAQEAGAVMARQPEGGVIVLVGVESIVRLRPDEFACVAGAASIPAMTRALAVEFAVRHPRIRVNCILAGEPTEVPAGRLAHAAVFLLENDAISGVVLPVAGGTGVAPTPAAGS